MSRIFKRTFAHPKTAFIRYKPEWESAHTPRDFSNIVSGALGPDLQPGQIVKTLARGVRPMLIVGTPLGNVVVYQRYPDNTEVFVFDAPQEVINLFSPIMVKVGKMDTEAMLVVFGNVDYPDDSPNIGKRLMVFLREAAKPALTIIDLARDLLSETVKLSKELK